jgi:alpha-galactosidase
LGKPRASRLTHAEQRTYLTLWCIARSPLFMGGNLTRMDRFTAGLLENPEVIAVDQHASAAHQARDRDGFVVWLSKPDSGGGWYLAAFNMQPRRRTLAVSWRELALPQARYRMRDLWQHRDRGVAANLTVRLDAHGAALFRLMSR